MADSSKMTITSTAQGVDQAKCPLRTRSAMAFPEPDEAVTGQSDVRMLARTRTAMLEEEDMVEVSVGRMRSATLPDAEASAKDSSRRSSKTSSFSTGSIMGQLRSMCK
mmetsp:Transcript_6207/g.13694  ORF Transcript_6207/g.13694 Transcript_6207/m.13694 type:complete len:108 (+) Transcript_6207:79-402(+)|eukprot:CAMPEP_0178405362 /NCGR_PEP_ID=MMETSP0689_2-20121128/18359_1 /TAXON_ID=160604 /ORGANISM="Amphidinium massartii, Strain CS-259" /LENGTH=107 /DNA_ID=CAMNT_0020026373 /DNA_START=79 /DNA_END=402 /DNA_ORIENTATION=-